MLVEMEIKIIESPVRDAIYFYRATMICYTENQEDETGSKYLAGL